MQKCYGILEDRKDVAAVFAGKMHTIALKKDGTVVATGNNDHGQCNVSDRKDVTELYIEKNYTVGKTSSGELLITGLCFYLIERVIIMSEKQRIISLFSLTPEEQAALLQKRAAAASAREHTDVQNITAVQTAAEFNNVKVYEAPTRSDAHGGKKSAKRIAAVVAIICAMLVGGSITVSLMSAKNAPAAGVSAVSGQNETSVLQSESSLPQKAAEKTVPSAQHDY